MTAITCGLGGAQRVAGAASPASHAAQQPCGGGAGSPPAWAPLAPREPLLAARARRRQGGSRRRDNAEKGANSQAIHALTRIVTWWDDGVNFQATARALQVSVATSGMNLVRS